MKQTDGQLWDRHVDDAFPRLQQANARLTYSGQEWGNEASWQRIFDKLFVPAGVADWRVAVEIGGGAGKYSEKALRAGPECRLFRFDVSQSALDASADRLGEFAAAGRLSLHGIDPQESDGMLRVMQAAGLAGQVDAVFSIDAMVHVDLTDLTAYWINAALLLKPGGRMLMTLADPTTPSGFQKILRDIRKFYRFQGRICPKFEYLSADIVRSVLQRLGFAIEVLEPWSNHVGRPARDLYLIARLDRPDLAARWRDALRLDLAGLDIAGLGPAQRVLPEAAGTQVETHAGETHVGATYADIWTREAAGAIAGQPDRPAAAVLARLFEGAELAGWRRAIEIGIGDARYTEAVLAANPQLRLTAFDVSDRIMQAAAAQLAPHVASRRLGVLPIDPLHPDGILTAFERERLEREVDAVFSIDAMHHVDLQYQIAYWLNAALVLRQGGWLLFSVADATTPSGFDRLIADIGRTFPSQGQASSRFEYQSFGLVRPLLERLGFDVTYAGHWNPLTGSDDGHDLFVVAQLTRPEVADALRGHLSNGLATPQFAGRGAAPGAASPPVPDEEEEEEATADVAQDLAQALGQALWRQSQLMANPGLSRTALATRLREQWGGNRREYTSLGRLVLRDLAESGITLHKTGGHPSDPFAAGDDTDDSNDSGQ